MRRTEAVVIGGGQAGLAMSRCLSEQRRRPRRPRARPRRRAVAQRALGLAPAPHPELAEPPPGFRYDGPDPDGYMRMPEVVDYPRALRPLLRRARRGASTTVLAVEPAGAGYRVTTDRGAWEAPSVVVATGHCDTPLVPGLASAPARRRRPGRPDPLPEPGPAPAGGVLVVGASASGRPARRRDPRLGPAGHARRRPAHAAAARLPRARHPLVARRAWASSTSPRPTCSTSRSPATSRPSSSWVGPTARRSTCRRSSSVACGSSAARRLPTGDRVFFADDLVVHDGGGRRPSRASRPEDRHLRGAHAASTPRWGRPSPSARSSGRSRRLPQIDLRPRASARSSGRRASRAATRG